MKTKERKKGISLIVLIITILVMIILGAAIILNLDDTKIIANAEKATKGNDIAVANEIRVVARTEWRVNESKLKEQGYTSFRSYLVSKLEEEGIEVGDDFEKIHVTDKGELLYYKDPTVPRGFVASQVPTEDEVSEGFVIYEGTKAVTEDNVDIAKTTRNQYVWVPVRSSDEFKMKNWGIGPAAEIFSAITSYNINFASEVSDYSAAKESILRYGGFYIGRYEAGKEGTNTVVTKKGATLYNSISWAEAESRASDMTTSSVVSHLVYGEEWDAALRFISKANSTYATTSGNTVGNYTASVMLTGDEDSFAVNNIYDMAGNAQEWSMEFNNGFRIRRGGTALGGDDTNYGAASRFVKNDIAPSVDTGFRVALYLI